MPAGAQARLRPDLRIAPFTIAKAPVMAGAIVRIRVRTRNVGRHAARRSVTALFLSADARRNRGDRRIGATRVRRMAAHRARRRTVVATIPLGTAAGRYRILACADPARRVPEARERNNCRAGRRVLTVLAGAGPIGGSGPITGPGPDTGTPVGPSGPVVNPAGDDDGDGLTNAVDCSSTDPTVYPGAPDPPDVPAFKDTNCDGIDGDAAHAVFVSPSGNDADSGSRATPKKTLAAAVSAATGLGADVYAMAGTYAARLDLANGVDVIGGYTTTWARSLGATTTITGAQASGRVEAAVASGLSAPTTLQLLTLAPKAATGAGVSSYGLRATGSPGLVVDHVTATAGAGTPGAPGTAGADGRSGGAGTNGTAGSCDNEIAQNAGGDGGTNAWGRPGGHGGMGGYGSAGSFGTDHYDGFDGGAGTVAGQGGGPGGGHGNGGTTGGSGGGGSSLNGASGANGPSGGGGLASFASGALWLGAAGGTGSNGLNGHGGGGGGGGGGQVGAAVDNGSGNGGGGGGGGGEGGKGGGGGAAGGASIGIAIATSSGAVIRDSVISAAGGAKGGAGADGGSYGAGGPRGFGATTCTGEVGSGGNGGVGGPGGHGGGGGGGAGGPSFALLRVSSTITAAGNTLTFGSGGAGGPGGSGVTTAGGTGAPGAAEAEHVS
ncbi:MAG: CARDB domain-containing protein [Solirubrobacteraceae bacterium]